MTGNCRLEYKASQLRPKQQQQQQQQQQQPNETKVVKIIKMASIRRGNTSTFCV